MITGRWWAALAVLVLAGCSSSPPPDDEPPAGVSVVVQQYRGDVTPRRIQISVTNSGPAPITVAAAQIVSARLTGRPQWREREPSDAAVIAPSLTVDLPVPLTASVCPPAGGSLAVRLDLRKDDGTTSWARLPATDPYGHLGRVQTADCTRARVERIARITPSFTPGTGRGVPGTLTLRFEPAGGPGTLTVRSVDPTTLVTPGAVPSSEPVTGTGAARTITLPVRPASCDQHIVAEDKVGSVVTLQVAVDGAPVPVVLPTDRARTKAAQSLVSVACGRGPG